MAAITSTTPKLDNFSVTENEWDTTAGWDVLAHDPLDDTVKRRITTVIRSFLIADEREEVTCPYQDTKYTRTKCILGSVLTPSHALTKTYDADPENLKKAKDLMEKHHRDYELLRKIVKDPTLKAAEFGIDPNNTLQVFAARVFIKSAIKCIAVPKDNSIGSIKLRYNQKMASAKNNRLAEGISGKNLLLMRADPLKKASSSGPDTPLDTILGNTHFEVPRIRTTSTVSGPMYPTPITKTVIHGPTREEARAIYLAEFQKLWDNPHTKHVLQALGTLIQLEKGNILFGSMSILGQPYGAEATAVFGGTAGFYQFKHSIIMDHLIGAMSNIASSSSIGTFIHESLHFLFHRIPGCKNDSTRNEVEERLLDQALEKDRLHRKKMKLDKLPRDQRSVFGTLKTSLEDETSYFPKGFDAKDEGHRRLMRNEAIVRVMEQIAQGVPPADVRKVAPNLYDFYFKYSKPVLETFVRDHAALFPQRSVAVSATTDTKLTTPAAVVPLKKPGCCFRIKQIWLNICACIKTIFTRKK